jgi:imidazole glycerol phosphate synthase glutamine amidotransferase subunit
MIAIVDYGTENISPIVNAVSEISTDYKVTSGELDITASDKIILPDAEDPSSVIKQLHKCSLFTMLRVCKKPVLGIGLGMLIMTDNFKEGNITGLGLFHGSVEEFDPGISAIPFKGLNEIEIKKVSKLFEDFKLHERFYFNNRFFLPLNDNTTSTANNGVTLSASLESDNFYGVQFLPEKSGDIGKKLIKNFMDL